MINKEEGVFMVIGVYANLERDIDCIQSKKLVGLFEGRGIKCVVCDNASKFFPMNNSPMNDVAQIADIMIVFGGDGTMLQVANKIIDFNTPILGINMGNLGFLTEGDHDDMSNVVEHIINSKYEIDNRMVLEADIDGEKFIAINEVSLSRSRSEHTVDIDIFVDGRLADVVTGDGVIVCTPTGSTAYAMSCGGAILSPGLSAMQIIAICPHSLHSRPIVVSDTSSVLLKLHRSKLNVVSVIIDGKQCLSTTHGVNVSKSDKQFALVRINEDNFYSKLINKMNGWNYVSRRID